MSPISLNFKGVQPAGIFAPFDDHTPIQFTIFTIVKKNTDNDPGRPNLLFTFKEVGSKRQALKNFSLQPKSLGFLKKFMIDFGIDPEELEGEDFSFDENDYLGEEVWLVFDKEKANPMTKSGKSQDILSITKERPTDEDENSF